MDQSESVINTVIRGKQRSAPALQAQPAVWGTWARSQFTRPSPVNWGINALSDGFPHTQAKIPKLLCSRLPDLPCPQIHVLTHTCTPLFPSHTGHQPVSSLHHAVSSD